MSCLFDSISTFVAESPATLRQQACDYLAKNGPLFDDKRAAEVVTPEYIQQMRHRSTWGGGIEIRALSEQLNLIIVVSGPATRRAIVFRPIRPAIGARHAFLSYNGSHYEPMPPIIYQG